MVSGLDPNKGHGLEAEAAFPCPPCTFRVLRALSVSSGHFPCPPGRLSVSSRPPFRVLRVLQTGHYSTPPLPPPPFECVSRETRAQLALDGGRKTDMEGVWVWVWVLDGAGE